MAKKRFIATSVILTTMLAAGGAAALYFTSASGAPWTGLAGAGQPADSSRLAHDGGESRAQSDSSLDAVASAWAQRETPPAAVSAESSRYARSAGATLARAESQPAPPAGDRYGEIQPGVVSPFDVAPPPRYAAEARATDSTAATAADAISDAPVVAQPVDRYPTMSEPAPTPDPLAVARGQDAPSAKDLNFNRDPRSAAVPTGADAASPIVPFDANELRQPEAERVRTGADQAAADRARQAFAEQPAIGVADRYGSSTSTQRSGDAASPGPGPSSYPFATQASKASSVVAQSSESAPSNAQMPQPANSPFETAAAGGSSYSDLSGNSRFASNAPSTPGEYGASPDARSGGLPTPFDGGASSGGNAAGMEGSGRPGERAFEGAQNPALVIQKLAPPEIQVNKPAKFVIQVRNVGGQAAADVVIRDQVPKGTQLLSTMPAAEVNGGQLVWRVGNLSIGEERSIEMQLLPIAEGEIGSVATVIYSAQASVKTRSTMPQLAIRMTTPKQVMVGQEHRVKIFLHNPGSGDATGVMLFENVPENVRHEAGTALEFEIGTLRAGETRELELILFAEKPGRVTNVLSARAEGNLQVQQQVEFDVIAPALTVAVVGPERRYLERPATYEVRVENPGTAPARDIQLVTKLPKGMKFVRANNMGEYDAGTHAVYWSLAELPEGEHGSVELVAMPIEPGPQTLEVEGRAQQGLSDQTKHPVLVEGLSAIMFEVRDLEDPIEVGKETAYEIRVVNQGTKAASNVQVAVALPQGMQFISAEGESRHSVQQNGVVFAPIRQLAPKADTIFRLKVQCRQPGDQRVTVEVKTDEIEPIRREESTRVFGDE